MIGIIGKLLARRLLSAIPILLAVSALLFCVLRVLPVDPAAMSLPPMATLKEIAAKRHEMGLDKPLPQQYWIWLVDALHGDFGRSIQFRRDSATLVANALPATIQLAGAAMLLAAILGVGGGLIMFRLRETVFVGTYPAVRVRRHVAFFAVHRTSLAGAAGAARDWISFTRLVAGGPLRCFLERVSAPHPARRRARSRLLADNHARAAFQLV